MPVQYKVIKSVVRQVQGAKVSLRLCARQPSDSSKTYYSLCWRTSLPNTTVNRRFYRSKNGSWTIPVCVAVEMLQDANDTGMLDVKYDDPFLRYGSWKEDRKHSKDETAPFWDGFLYTTLPKGVENRKQLYNIDNLLVDDRDAADWSAGLGIVGVEPRKQVLKVMLLDSALERCTFRTWTNKSGPGMVRPRLAGELAPKSRGRYLDNSMPDIPVQFVREFFCVLTDKVFKTTLEVGKEYSRVQVQDAIGVQSPTHKGKWGTGYTEHEGAFFIFANIGNAGRTGHDYPNEWSGDLLHWSAKSNTTLQQPLIRRLISPNVTAHIFVRYADREPFIYRGKARPTEPRGERPVMLTWAFDFQDDPPPNSGPSSIPKIPLHDDYRPAKYTKIQSDDVRKEGVLVRNPALVERAVQAHSNTQNALAEYVRGRGWEPLSPRGTIDYDIAWRESDSLTVGEVKSITEANEVSQLRTGVGQLLDYAAELHHQGEKVGRLFMVLEREPRSMQHWERVCKRAGIQLTWAPSFHGI